jgi:drug/metabolite transporter (DMT)-like permease
MGAGKAPAPGKIARFANTRSTAVQQTRTFPPQYRNDAKSRVRRTAGIRDGPHRGNGQRDTGCAPDPPKKQPVQRTSQDLKARLMLVALSLAWGLTWPASRIALGDIPPFSTRVGSLAVGTTALYLLARTQGAKLRIRGAMVWLHVVVICLLNMTVFSMFTLFAQLNAPTSRVAMMVYTMPIWTSLFARIFLGERFTRAGAVALGLCLVGMTVLILPLTFAGVPLGVLLALGAAMSWSAATVYMKWADIDVDPIAMSVWQGVIAIVTLGVCIPLFQDKVHLFDAPPRALIALVFAGLMGSGIAYFLWYNVIRLVPAMTASLGVLSAPVVGVISSVIILGERPTPLDIVGFVLIFAASACVLLQPQGRSPGPEPA